jgi:hypothetical protein
MLTRPNLSKNPVIKRNAAVSSKRISKKDCKPILHMFLSFLRTVHKLVMLTRPNLSKNPVIKRNAAVSSKRPSKKDCQLILFVFLSLTQHCSQANNADTA